LKYQFVVANPISSPPLLNPHLDCVVLEKYMGRVVNHMVLDQRLKRNAPNDINPVIKSLISSDLHHLQSAVKIGSFDRPGYFRNLRFSFMPQASQ